MVDNPNPEKYKSPLLMFVFLVMTLPTLGILFGGCVVPGILAIIGAAIFGDDAGGGSPLFGLVSVFIGLVGGVALCLKIMVTKMRP